MLYLIYTTDVWHTYTSHELIAIATSKKQCYSLIRKYLKRYGVKLDKEQLDMLDSIKQTQGLTDDYPKLPMAYEIVISEADKNVLLSN